MKFDKDYKITKNQFYFLLCFIAGEENENYDALFHEAAGAFETGKFTGDLNNELFVKIQ